MQTQSDIINTGLPVCSRVFIRGLLPPELRLSGVNRQISFYAHLRLNIVLGMPGEALIHLQLDTGLKV